MIFRCSCGAPIGLASFCSACGKKRGLAKPLVLTLGLAAVIALVIFAVTRPKATTNAPSGSLTSHHLTGISDPKKAMEQVDALLKKGDQAACLEAVALLDALLSQYSDFGYGLRLKANLLRDLHRDKEALASYQTFLAAHPEDQRTRMAMADVLLRGEKPEQGIALLEDIAVKCPNYAEVHDRLVVAYTRANNTERAEAHRAVSATLAAQKTQQKPPFVYLPRVPGT